MPPSYDAQSISKQRGLFAGMDQASDAWFATKRTPPFRVTYEDMPVDPFGALAQILKALGLKDKRTGDRTPTVAKLADAVSTDWADSYVKEMRDPWGVTVMAS